MHEITPFPVIGDALFIDNSTLTNFVECSRRGFYRIVRRREPSHTAWALEYGRRIHKALEERYANGDQMATQQTTERMREKLCEQWAELGPEPEGEWRHLSLACAAVADYNHQYRFEGFSVLTLPNDMLACELAFAEPLCTIETPGLRVRDIETLQESVVDELPVFYTGRIDLITREQDETNLVTDHKTSSMGGPQQFSEYYTGAQMKGYCWAGERLLGKRIHGARINVFGSRKPTKTKEFNTFFDRDIIYYSQDTIDEWEWNTIELITQFMRQVLDAQQQDSVLAHAMHTTQCIGKYGACPYYRICQLPPQQREFGLNTGDYKDVTWDPTKDQQEKGKPVASTENDNFKPGVLDSIRSFIDG